MRGRGLKLEQDADIVAFVYVAPHAGAWIETELGRTSTKTLDVAPHAGAWIETWPGPGVPRRLRVAPHAGAWIETCRRALSSSVPRSPPMRGRGLKPIEM